MTSSEEGSFSSDGSVDIFDDDDDLDKYEDLMLKSGDPCNLFPSANQWTYEAFTQRGGEYAGTMKSIVLNDEHPLQIQYNLVDDILMEKAKIEIPKAVGMVQDSLYENSKTNEVTPFSSFASVCPEDFFTTFRKWLRLGIGASFFTLF